MFFAFLGFESISMAVDEIKEPQKNVPRGIVLSLLITTGSLYFGYLSFDRYGSF